MRFLFLRKKRKTICWNVIVGNFSHLILVSKSTWVYSVKEIPNTCGNEHQKEKREYPSAVIRRLVNGFVHDLRPPQLHMFLSAADRVLSSSPAVFVVSSAQETEKDITPAERERVRKLTHRLHVSGGHVSKTSLRLLLQRRGCPVWMQQMVDLLQCDSCLESSDAQNAQQVSLATPPKLWQAVKIDIFELKDSQKKGFFALYMDAACKLSSCSCFLEGDPRQRFEPNGATLMVDVSSVLNCENGQVFEALVS